MDEKVDEKIEAKIIPEGVIANYLEPKSAQ